MRRLPTRQLLTIVPLRYFAMAGLIALLASCGGAGTGSGAGGSETSPYDATNYAFVESWGATDGSGNPVSGTGSDAFASPSGMVFGPNGDIYVTDRNNHTVKVYSATGAHQATWDFPDGAPDVIRPSDIAYDPVKKQFAVIGSWARELYFFNTDGTFPNPVSIHFPDGTGTTEAKDPQAIAVDDAGYLYLLERDNNRIKKLTSGGVVQDHFGATDNSGEPVAGSGPGEFDNPFDLGFYNGYLFVADNGNDRIQVLETDGTFVEEFSDPGTGSGQFPSPWEIFVDPLGNRYVTNYERVLKYDDQWNLITEIGSGSAGTGPGEFDNPAGLTVHSNGYVYVADQYNHRVQVFRPVD